MTRPGRSRRARPTGGPRRPLRLAAFAGWYLGRFLQANVTVAREIVTPRSTLAPAIVEFPLRCGTRGETASFMMLITLLPGTTALRAREDRSWLLVHGMHAADPEAFVADLRDLERRMLGAWRPGRPGPDPLDGPVHGG